MLKQFLLFIFIFGFAFLLVSCDDAGIAEYQNNGTFSHTHLKRLDPNVDGVYELWVSFSTSTDHEDNSYISMGRFNIDAAGNVVDTNGGTKTFNFRRTPPSITSAGDALVTIQQPGNNDTIPSGTKILGGLATVGTDFVTFNMTMSYSEVLGNIASQFTSDSCKYILNTPFTPDTTDFYRGIYLTNNISASLNGLTCQTIPDSLGWEYQGWIYKIALPTERYSIGKFSNPSNQTTAPTCGITGGYNKPGVEFRTSDSVCTNNSVINLNDGQWAFMITLEPKNESAVSTPFFIRLFDGSISTLVYNGPYGLINRTASSYIPTGNLSISRQ